MNGQRLLTSENEVSAYCNGPDWKKDTIYPHAMGRSEANFVRSVRNIYTQHGWPNSFDRDACWRALEDFEEERSEFEGAMDRACPIHLNPRIATSPKTRPEQN
jgi:hypothetical protein